MADTNQVCGPTLVHAQAGYAGALGNAAHGATDLRTDVLRDSLWKINLMTLLVTGD